LVVSGCPLVSSSLACATPIETIWHISGISQFDYVSGKYETPKVPTEFDLKITFPDAVAQSIDYGQENITYFGNLGETTFVSPLTAFIGADPFGVGLAGQEAYTFPNSNDYPSGFEAEFAAQSNAYSAAASGAFWDYHVELRAQRRGPSLGGTGTADYPFTSASLMDFLADVQKAPSDYELLFNESWQIFDRDTSTEIDGKSWSAYSPTMSLISVNDPSAVSVPEPPTWQLLCTGILALGIAMRGHTLKVRRAST
jgi:hypothetical protein